MNPHLSFAELNARERVAQLLDPDSFCEILGPAARTVSPHLALLGVPYAFDDGVVIGSGLLQGYPVLIEALARLPAAERPVVDAVGPGPMLAEHEGHLRRALGLPSLVLFGLVYIVPLTVFTTYGIVTETTGGRLPVAYVVTLIAMGFTALSYARMVVAFPVAGSAYTYTQKTFGPPIGFLAGWSLLLDYLFLPMLNYLVIGIYMAAAFPGVPAWVFIVVSVAIVTVLNIVGIVSVARANFLIIAVQVVFIVTFLAMAIMTLTGRGSIDVAAPFRGDGTATGVGVIFAGAAVLCLSFLGFDAVSTLSEEAKRPTHDVPRAIIFATLGAGLLFIVLSFLSQLVFPSNAFADVDSGSLDVMRTAGGKFLETFFTAAYVAGCIGSALTSQASVARILFAMGRDGILPRPFFGHVSARFSTPVYAIVLVSLVSLLALVNVISASPLSSATASAISWNRA
jgi:amino acid transporter